MSSLSKRESAGSGNIAPGRSILYYLDIALKVGDAPVARQIVLALGEKRAGKGICASSSDWEGVEYTEPEDRAANAWKFEYLDFEGRAAALKAMEADLDGIDAEWRDCLIIG